MKTFNIIITGIFIAILFAGCEEADRCIEGSGAYAVREYNVSNFNSISIAGTADVYIKHDTRRSLRIEAQPNILNNMKIENYRNNLSVEPDHCIKDFKRPRIYISTPDLEELNTSGNIDVFSPDVFTGKIFRTKIAGTGLIELNLDVDEYVATISGNGTINAAGYANKQYYKTSGVGDFQSFRLQGQHANVDVSGSANTEVNVSNSLFADVSGTATIHYMGNPKITQDVSGTVSLINVP